MLIELGASANLYYIAVVSLCMCAEWNLQVSAWVEAGADYNTIVLLGNNRMRAVIPMVCRSWEFMKMKLCVSNEYMIMPLLVAMSWRLCTIWDLHYVLLYFGRANTEESGENSEKSRNLNPVKKWRSWDHEYSGSLVKYGNQWQGPEDFLAYSPSLLILQIHIIEFTVVCVSK